jgi:hypothetical protein
VRVVESRRGSLRDLHRAVAFDDGWRAADVILVAVGEHDLLDALTARPLEGGIEYRQVGFSTLSGVE